MGDPLLFFPGVTLTYRSQGKDLLDMVEKHRDCLFLMFTNGTVINQETAHALANWQPYPPYRLKVWASKPINAGGRYL